MSLRKPPRKCEQQISHQKCEAQIPESREKEREKLLLARSYSLSTLLLLAPTLRLRNFFIVVSASVAVLFSIALSPLRRTNYLGNLRIPWSSSSLVADLVVSNGIIYTRDASLPFADFMAVRGGRVLRVGNYSSVQV